MSQQYPSRIRYEYEQDPETRLQYTHGVWGGINPQGEIEISFYLESDKMPPYSERIIAPDGSFGHEIAPYNDEERTITRHIHSRVVMNYHTARAMLEWLEDKVAAFEPVRKPVYRRSLTGTSFLPSSTSISVASPMPHPASGCSVLPFANPAHSKKCWHPRLPNGLTLPAPPLRSRKPPVSKGED